MKTEALAIPDIILVNPARFGDSRGFFSETWNAARYAAAGITGTFIQDNHSLSARRGTIRGLHCQIAPSVQGKLVRVVRGAIWDVAVNLRRGSPTYGQHAAAVLSAENWAQLWIPGGFLHGFCTLEDDTEVVYKVAGGQYDPTAERGVIWNDPDLALPWPVAPEAATLSDKDARLPALAACDPWFYGVDPAMTAGPILVTGGAGQLATALEAAAGGRAIRRVGRPAFDFDRPDQLPALLRELAPALIVNAAAYTAVDKAEAEPDAAMRANRDGPALLAQDRAVAGIPLIHVSTDYVFDGLKGAPYVETDRTGPTGVYGVTKLAGEQAVLESCPRAVVLRTSWVYSTGGRNFVLTMLNAAAKTDRLRVVADQVGCPTSADDLAAAILGIADRIAATGWLPAYGGVFHAAGTGDTSWHGLANAVFATAATHGLAPPVVAAIATADMADTGTATAGFPELDCGKLADTFGVALPPWRDTVAWTVAQIFAQRRAAPPTRPNLSSPGMQSP